MGMIKDKALKSNKDNPAFKVDWTNNKTNNKTPIQNLLVR